MQSYGGISPLPILCKVCKNLTAREKLPNFAKNTTMTKRIKRDDPMYIEALSWMSYRYAIGVTEYPKRNGLSDVERYRMFRDIEFNTEDFQAVAAAFTDFLKRKKITDIVTLDMAFSQLRHGTALLCGISLRRHHEIFQRCAISRKERIHGS